MMKKNVIYIISGILVLSTLLIVIFGRPDSANEPVAYDDGIIQIDADTIALEKGKVRIDFSKVLLSGQEEMRKLIVLSQDATASYKITRNISTKYDFEWTRKEEEAHYTATGYFTVDLSKLTESDLENDEDKKVLTIKVEKPALETVTIDPEKIFFDNKKSGFLALGELMITLEEYRDIEIVLKSRLEKEYNTPTNIREAEKKGLEMVKQVYEPIVKAIDDEYSVVVKYK